MSKRPRTTDLARRNERDYIVNQTRSLYGMRFGLLMVVKIHCEKLGMKYWVCTCNCGEEVIVREVDLRKHRKTSCDKPECKTKATQESEALSQRNDYILRRYEEIKRLAQT